MQGGPEEPRPPKDGGAIQRQRGFFGRRSVLESSGAVKPPEPAKPPDQPEAAPAAQIPPSDTKAGRKATRKAAARAAMAARGGSTPLRSRRRTGTVALVLVGATALGVGGAWMADRMMRPACDPRLDPACQQASSTGSSGGGSSSRTGSSQSSSSSSSARSSSGGSWLSWGNDSSSGVAAIPGSAARDSTVKRGGFGSIGRFFSSGG